MAKYKVIIFFKTDSQGWTETLYWEHPTFGEGTLQQDIRDLLVPRRALLGTDAFVQGYRYTDLTLTVNPLTGARVTSHPSVLKRRTAPGSSAGTAPDKVGNPWSCFLVNLYNLSEVYRRSFLLRGMPQIWDLWTSTNPVVPVLPALMETALNNWATVLAGPIVDAPNTRAGTRWCLLGRSKDANQVGPVDILAVNTFSNEDPRFTILIPQLPAFVIGDIVHVHNVRACTARGINGDSVVVGVSSLLPGFQTLTLSKRQCCTGGIVYTGKGKATKVIRSVYAPIAKVRYGRTVNRKSGRPFFGTRGRQSAKCCG